MTKQVLLALAMLLVLDGCGGSKDPEMPSTWANFQCKDRKVAYMVVGGMAAQEAGVTIDCNSEHGPRVVRYVADNDGGKIEDSAAMTPGEFDDLWTRIEGTGWRHLGDCTPDLGDDIPVYQFDVADWNGSETFGCDALRPEFPYDTIINELDQKAATIGGDRGKNMMDIDDSGLE